MAKRKFISREEALSHPFANGKYDHKYASIDFILGHESYEEWLETLSAFTEQDIVKPYLEKIRAEIEPTRKMYFEMNDVDWINGCDYVLSIIDKYKAGEQER